jgi:hypothetical protein
MKKYIKKPIPVDAKQFEYTTECLDKLKVWMGDSMGSYGKERHPAALGWLRVKTLEDMVKPSIKLLMWLLKVITF